MASTLTQNAAGGLAISKGDRFFHHRCRPAAGTVWGLFAKDVPPQPSHATTTYFVAVLASLGFVMWLMPGQGFGTP